MHIVIMKQRRWFMQAPFELLNMGLYSRQREYFSTDVPSAMTPQNPLVTQEWDAPRGDQSQTGWEGIVAVKQQWSVQVVYQSSFPEQHENLRPLIIILVHPFLYQLSFVWSSHTGLDCTEQGVQHMHLGSWCSPLASVGIQRSLMGNQTHSLT